MPRKYVKKTTTKVYKRKPKQSLEKVVKKVIQRQAEPKAFMSTVTEYVNNTNTAIQAFGLNEIPVGTSSSDRIGDMVTSKMVDIRGHIYGTYQQPVFHKLMLIEQNAQSDPAVDLFENNSGIAAPIAADISSIYQRVNTAKYRVLATRVLKTGTVSNTANDMGAAQLFHITAKLPGKVVFNGQPGTPPPQKRWLRLILFSRTAANDTTLGEQFEISFSSKYYYSDM